MAGVAEGLVAEWHSAAVAQVSYGLFEVVEAFSQSSSAAAECQAPTDEKLNLAT